MTKHERLSFTERNALRKATRATALLTVNRKYLNQARLDRRIRGGKFGLAPNHIFNELALGTTAIVRDKESS